MPRVAAVIPARMASTRFPGKPLAPIQGIPMVEHVRARASFADSVDEVIVATCDDEIRRAVESAGGRVVMTADTHERCTERVEEAAHEIDAGIFVIAQGDEPLLVPADLDRVVAPLLASADASCTNLMSPLGPGDAENPDIVKAATDRDGRIMYFSRAPIPFRRNEAPAAPVHRQTGIMAFTTDALHEYVALEPTPLERIESVDMLRLLENGRPIRGVPVDHATVGVDRPEDVDTVENEMQTDDEQARLFERVQAFLGPVVEEAA